MKTYLVTLSHDKGRVKILTRAASYQNAITNVCAAERAPESAVCSVCVKETQRQSRRAVKLCQDHAFDCGN